MNKENERRRVLAALLYGAKSYLSMRDVPPMRLAYLAGAVGVQSLNYGWGWVGDWPWCQDAERDCELERNEILISIERNEILISIEPEAEKVLQRLSWTLRLFENRSAWADALARVHHAVVWHLLTVDEALDAVVDAGTDMSLAVRAATELSAHGYLRREAVRINGPT